MRNPDELAQVFRSSGRKMTPQRRTIFEALHGSAAHPTAEAVYAAVKAEMPTISLRTVYQTLNDLADMGEIHAIDLGTGSARFDPTIEPHHHVVCDNCGWVQDVELDTASPAVPASVDPDFEVTATEIVFRGRCQRCAALTADEPVPARSD